MKFYRKVFILYVKNFILKIFCILFGFNSINFSQLSRIENLKQDKVFNKISDLSKLFNKLLTK